MDDFAIVTKSNGDGLEKLIYKYNFLIEELNETVSKIITYKLEIETKKIKIPKSEM